MQGLYKKVITGDYPPISSRYSQDLSKVISMLLKVDPKKRPNCDILLNDPIVLKHCSAADPVASESNLLSTIKVPKHIGALANSLPSSNYSAQKISNKFPDAFRIPQGRILSEQYLKNKTDSEENIGGRDMVKKYENSKMKSELTPIRKLKSPYKHETIAQQIQALKAQYDKVSIMMPPVKNSYNRANIKPSWWG